MTLTKADLTDSIYNRLDFPKHKAAHLAEALFKIMKKTLENGEDVLISGFGKLCVNEKKERRGRNPQTGEDMRLRPRRVVTFRCSGVLRDKINEKG